MDGYAVRSADITAVMTGEPVKLRVVATVAAGGFAPRSLRRGEAMRIMTGAPIPDGADSVIRKEDTDGGSEKVEIREARDVCGGDAARRVMVGQSRPIFLASFSFVPPLLSIVSGFLNIGVEVAGGSREQHGRVALHERAVTHDVQPTEPVIEASEEVRVLR